MTIDDTEVLIYFEAGAGMNIVKSLLFEKGTLELENRS